MKITICNQKGGAGKTTLTMLLAMALSNAGKKIGIYDLDKQATATRWIDALEDDNISLATKKTEENFDLIFYDTPPALTSTLKQASEASDLTVIVSSPSPADLWSTKETIEWLGEGINKRVLFNKTEKGRKLSSDLALLTELIGEQSFKNSVPYYSAYQHAVLNGWNALARKDSDPILQIALEIII